MLPRVYLNDAITGTLLASDESAALMCVMYYLYIFIIIIFFIINLYILCINDFLVNGLIEQAENKVNKICRQF